MNVISMAPLDMNEKRKKRGQSRRRKINKRKRPRIEKEAPSDEDSDYEFEGDDDDDDEEHALETEIPSAAAIRVAATNTNQARPSVPQSRQKRGRYSAAIRENQPAGTIQSIRPRQRWTELTAVGQILADEVTKFLNPGHEITISEGEQRQLHTWVGSVQRKIYHHSTLVLENVELMTILRSQLGRIQGLRDDLMITRTRTRKLEKESEEIKANLKQKRDEQTFKREASKFLSSLEKIAKSSQTSGEAKPNERRHRVDGSNSDTIL